MLFSKVHPIFMHLTFGNCCNDYPLLNSVSEFPIFLAINIKYFCFFAFFLSSQSIIYFTHFYIINCKIIERHKKLTFVEPFSYIRSLKLSEASSSRLKLGFLFKQTITEIVRLISTFLIEHFVCF